MNTYVIEFFARCPSNGLRIKYVLKVETEAGRVVMAEDILECIDANTREPVYHERLADALKAQLPGRHTLTAHHHGVGIVTTREGRP